MAGSGSPDDYIAVAVNGVDAEVAPSAVAAIVGGPFMTPSQTFAFQYNGVTLTFNVGDPVEVDPSLQAALVAASAPIA